LKTMPGSPPDLVNPPKGCVFHPRCPQVMDICKQETPPRFRIRRSYGRLLAV
jgi:oligopeptide/dipeptide ABC transporter ATP-binding protein